MAHAREVRSQAELESWQTFKGRLGIFSPFDQRRIDAAYDAVKVFHHGQFRESGEEYFAHPRAVATILLDECHVTDPDIIVAALYHDVVEDTLAFGHYDNVLNTEWMETAQWRLEQNNLVGPRAAEMILSVTKPQIDGVEVKSEEERDALYFKRLSSASPGALLLKMADRLHNLRTLHVRESKDREKVIRQTREVYIPIFQRALETYPQEASYLLAQIDELIRES